MVRTPQCLTHFTSKCASRHNGVQFFISHVASWLRTRRFSEPTLRPSGATNHWKNTVFRDFPTFSRICIFFLLTLSLLIFSLLIFLFSLPLPCSAFHLSILSEVWLLNFLRSSLPTRWTSLMTFQPTFTPALRQKCNQLKLAFVKTTTNQSWCLVVDSCHLACDTQPLSLLVESKAATQPCWPFPGYSLFA